jgi:purine nucleosidase
MNPAFTRPGDAWYLERLAPALTPVRCVIDTDAANEIDDQFALAWALRSPASLRVEAVYAAPFSFAHRRGSLPHAPPGAAPFNPPAEGMHRSHREILRIFGILGLDAAGRVFAGSDAYLPAPGQPVDSDAVRHLIQLARATPANEPLYVVALGCVTNVASALLIAPDIAQRIVVVWTSGYPSHAPHVNDSFNLEQDPAASRALLDSGVPVVYLPGFHVGAQLRLSLAEVEQHLRGGSPIGDDLHRLFTNNPLWELHPNDPTRPYSWVIWDLICVAWLLEPRWVSTYITRTPQLGPDLRWQPDPARPPMREAHAVDRDAIFNDLFEKLGRLRPDPAAPGG